MAGENDNRQSAIAAAIFLVVAGLALYFMPNIVLWIGGFSPALAVIAGVAVIGAFFGVFWVRSRYQRR
ncbi:asparagine N-glycosylation enzyme membrane subunit Stt3 [Rhizobium aquaticum]|uniref:Asparagine N-glycosylation enzyme membrane subunit Stt3 n=1 Tax=Rhizobium aquaticum TaxID=1549636 RepID=A0ABV2J183_9HYPH